MQELGSQPSINLGKNGDAKSARSDFASPARKDQQRCKFQGRKDQHRSFELVFGNFSFRKWINLERCDLQDLIEDSMEDSMRRMSDTKLWRIWVSLIRQPHVEMRRTQCTLKAQLAPPSL
jgi:hypothetical protein